MLKQTKVDADDGGEDKRWSRQTSRQTNVGADKHWSRQKSERTNVRADNS